MDNNKYAIFYRKDKDSYGRYIRPDLPVEQWEDYCKQQGYYEYNILDFSKYWTGDIHLLTDVTIFQDRYYLPEEKIPYPFPEPKNVSPLTATMYWEDEEEFFEGDYDEVYNEQSIDWGWGYLWTDIITKLSANENMDELGIVAQGFINDIPPFLEKLKNEQYAIYSNAEYSPFKWICWIKGDKVRMIHQDYRGDKVNTEFDILTDKEQFFNLLDYMLNTMANYAEKDLARYKKYVKEKYNKDL